CHGEAHSVNRDRSLVDEQRAERRRRRHLEPDALALGPDGGDPADAVDVSEHQMAAHPILEPERSLQVHWVARDEPSQRRHAEPLLREVECEPARRRVHDGEAYAAHGHAPPEPEAPAGLRGHGHSEPWAAPHGFHRFDAAERLDDPSEHDQRAMSASTRRSSSSRRVTTSISWTASLSGRPRPPSGPGVWPP